MIQLLNDPETGQLLAICEANSLTQLRTAATTALATDVLAPRPIKHIAIIGLGAQALYHIDALHHLHQDAQFLLFDQNRDRGQTLKQEYTGEAHLICAASLKEACHQADVIVTLTPSKAPYLALEHIKKPVLILI